MTFQFGKHSGQPLEDVPSHYLRWSLGSGHNGQPVVRSDAFRREIERELAQRDTDDQPDEPRGLHNGRRETERPGREYTPPANAPRGTAQYMNRPAADRAHDELRALLVRIEQRLERIEVAMVGQPAAVDDDDMAF